MSCVDAIATVTEYMRAAIEKKHSGQSCRRILVRDQSFANQSFKLSIKLSKLWSIFGSTGKSNAIKCNASSKFTNYLREAYRVEH